MNGPEVVILSHGLWQRRFGGDVSIVERAVQVNGKNTIAGRTTPIFLKSFSFPHQRRSFVIGRGLDGYIDHQLRPDQVVSHSRRC